MISNPIQKSILSNLSFHQAGATFTELNTGDAKVESDLFNYHLKQLIKSELIIKESSKYLLTEKGKSTVTNLDHLTKEITKYKVGVYLCIVVDNKILLTRRLKHPQYGYVGLVAGKMKYGESIKLAAARELEEETDLKSTVDYEIIGNLRQIRKNDEGKVIEDGVFYVCYSDSVEGELREKDIEGEYFWVDLNDVSKIEKIFKPSLEVIVEHIQKSKEDNSKEIPRFIYEFEPEPEEY